MATTLIATPDDNPYRGITNLAEFIGTLGRSIALSGMFGCENEAQGNVLALACVAKRCDPLTLAETYHIMRGGKLSKKADAILRDLGRCGGSHRIICRTTDKAEIEITYNGETQRFPFTWEEADKEPFTRKKGGELMDNYATPRKRMQMLWARVVSDGVRAMCPEAVCGTYTPEEVSDYQGGGQTVDEPMAAPSRHEEAEVVDVEVESVPVSQEVTKPVKRGGSDEMFHELVPTPTTETNGYCTTEQSTTIRELFDRLQIPAEAREKALAKRGAAAIRNLSHEAAAAFIASLQEKWHKTLAGESRSDPSAINQDNCDPCTESQIERARQLIKEIAQQVGPQIANQVKARLVACGLDKIADLTVSECSKLLDALAMKNLESWIGQALLGHKTRPGNGGTPL